MLVGLLAVGPGLDFKAMRQTGFTVGLSTAIKLFALPLVTYFICLMMDIDGSSQMMIVLYAALPDSATSYALARQMGRDTALLTGTITATTVIAMITMPLNVLLLN